jgi:hypothetical protein
MFRRGLGCAWYTGPRRPHAILVIAALNSAQETFSAISYTDIYTNTDEVVVPNFGPAASSSRTTSEPPLACYVTATCPTGRAAPQRRSSRALSSRGSPGGTRPVVTRRHRTRRHRTPLPSAPGPRSSVDRATDF